MKAAIKRQVRKRANGCCEYCRIPVGTVPTPFPVDHIIVRKHGGSSKLENLALACYRCNMFKGPNIAGMDVRTGKIVRLFNPRKDRWQENFRLLANGKIVARTSIGRATVSVLSVNHPEIVMVRAILIARNKIVADQA